MLEAVATVVAYSKGQATLSWQSQSACGHCQQADDCGSGVVSKALGAKQNRLTVAVPTPYEVGTQLRIGFGESDLVRAAAMVYLLPLVGALVTSLLAQATLGHEGAVILMALIGGGCGWAVARTWAAKQAPAITILGQLGSGRLDP